MDDRRSSTSSQSPARAAVRTINATAFPLLLSGFNSGAVVVKEGCHGDNAETCGGRIFSSEDEKVGSEEAGTSSRVVFIHVESGNKDHKRERRRALLGLHGGHGAFALEGVLEASPLTQSHASNRSAKELKAAGETVRGISSSSWSTSGGDGLVTSGASRKRPSLGFSSRVLRERGRESKDERDGTVCGKRRIKCSTVRRNTWHASSTTSGVSENGTSSVFSSRFFFLVPKRRAECHWKQATQVI